VNCLTKPKLLTIFTPFPKKKSHPVRNKESNLLCPIDIFRYRRPKITKCVFNTAVTRIDFDIIEFEIIDFR